MSGRFDSIAQKMPGFLHQLETSATLSRDLLNGIPEKGVYVFYEAGRPLYVGRSGRRRLRKRIVSHGRRSASHNVASFAFNLAKSMAKPGDLPEGLKRQELENTPAFKAPFDEAKKRVSLMEIRVIGMDDPVEQAVFEICAAIELETPFNDFGTH